MALSMRRAFNSRMYTTITIYVQEDGSYNEYNDWVSGQLTSRLSRGVIQAGNKFSQFEEGMAVINEDGGVRVSDYRSLYIKSEEEIKLGDKIGYNGIYYNVLQQSDESTYGFDSFLLEKSKNWSPE